METSSDAPRYRVWGADNVAYGPIELTGLTAWVLDNRVTPSTWIFPEEQKTWIPAADLPELAVCFERVARRTAGDAGTPPTAGGEGIRAGSLRRIKLLAGMEERQLESFIRFMEVVPVRQFAEVVRRGEHGDSMYLVLEGELRARIMVDNKETTLTTMHVGDFFGELSLLDAGPRSADVLANSDGRLLRISAASLKRVMQEAPALAAGFLYELSRSIGSRVRTLTQKYQDSIHFSRMGTAPRE